MDPNFLKVNQKFDLIAALLEVGAYDSADLLLKKLKDCKPSSHPRISYFLFNRIKKDLTGFLPSKSKSRIFCNDAVENKKESEDLKSLMMKSAEILKDCSPFLSRDIGLFSMLCRILVVHFSQDVDIVDDMIRCVLLPAFSLIPANVGVSADLWSLLKLFDYNQRFSWYEFWRSSVYSSCTELLAVQTASKKASAAFDRRIAAGVEKNKEFSRQLVKITHSNPIIVIEPMLKKIQVRFFL